MEILASMKIEMVTSLFYGDCDDGYKCHGYEDGEPIPLRFREEGY